MRVQLIRSSLLRKELQLGHLRALLIEPVDRHAGRVTGRNRNVRFLSLPFHAINAEIEARIQVAIGGDDQLVALESRSLGLIRMRVPRFHKEPEAGDLLHFSDVKARHVEDVNRMRAVVDVWNLRVPNLPCPFRVEENKLLCRMRPDRTGQEPYWEEDYRTAEDDWWRIECDALGERAGCFPSEGYSPTLSSVEFVGVVDGQHRCRAGSRLTGALALYDADSLRRF